MTVEAGAEEKGKGKVKLRLLVGGKKGRGGGEAEIMRRRKGGRVCKPKN